MCVISGMVGANKNHTHPENVDPRVYTRTLIELLSWVHVSRVGVVFVLLQPPQK